MKYIMVFHANLQYSGLRPEKYEFAIRKSYERIIDLFARCFRGHKFCFEASGFTLDMIAKLTPDVLKKLLDAIERGDCEFIGSPYAHSILPNYDYEDGYRACCFAMDSYQKHLGIRPKTAWNPECAWNEDVPHMYKEAGFEIMSLDWDSYLISNRPEVANIEKNPDTGTKDGSHLPWYPVAPDDPTLHYPINVIDGLKGVFRSDRVSAQTLYYLMSTSPIHVDDAGKKKVSLEQILETIDYWTGRKKQGSLICYAEDAEYVGTTGYFFLKHFGKHEVFDDNPDSLNLLEAYIRSLLKRGELVRIDEFVAENDALEIDLKIGRNMAWHRTYATAWAKTPSALALDPYCHNLSKKLQAIRDERRTMEEELLYQKAWFHLICAENSDGRWPPYPKKPGNFNVRYVWDQLYKAQEAFEDLARTDFKLIPSTEINPSM